MDKTAQEYNRELPVDEKYWTKEFFDLVDNLDRTRGNWTQQVRRVETFFRTVENAATATGRAEERERISTKMWTLEKSQHTHNVGSWETEEDHWYNEALKDVQNIIVEEPTETITRDGSTKETGNTSLPDQEGRDG